jgi:hypothetical protein
MKAEDVPFFAALIFPGFFAIQTFIWTTGRLSMSDAMRVTWAFIYSVPIFFATHGFFRHVAMLSHATLVPPAALAKNAAHAPLWFLASLYVGAALAGYLVGRVWQTQMLDAVLLKMGLDIRRHRGILSQVLGQRGYVDVKIKDGRLFRGWPFMYNSDDEDSFLYLVKVRRSDEHGNWTDSRDVLMTLDTVERIYPIDPERPLRRADEEPNGGKRRRLFRSRLKNAS